MREYAYTVSQGIIRDRPSQLWTESKGCRFLAGGESVRQPADGESKSRSQFVKFVMRKPYYEKPKFKLYQANCLELLAELPENSHDD